MSDRFFERPVLNSPYKIPDQHWEIDENGQPTQKILPNRRPAEYITPYPKAKKHKESKAGGKGQQESLAVGVDHGLSTQSQQYDPHELINLLRMELVRWRKIPNSRDWGVTHVTERLLKYWRKDDWPGLRPFFCQVEAVESVIWLTEVAPNVKEGKKFLDNLRKTNREANPELMRLALKLATGAGKTTVMAMLIAWQTINAVRRPNSKRFTNGFLVVTPGITIKDRLRVLQPNDPDSYYKHRDLVPTDMIQDLFKAQIVITNYHAFKLSEKVPLSKGGRSLLQGRGEELKTQQTIGEMLREVMPNLMGMKNILVINDEAHHCYREKPEAAEKKKFKGDEKEEADKNNEAARVWISGLEMVKKKLGLLNVIDLSATPYFLRGSGYEEGTLFPWTMSDFSLMDAIECGIVKLPRIPVSDDIPSSDVPIYRELWDHIGKKMPKKGRGKSPKLDPLDIPVLLQNALNSLYGHYEKTYEAWQKEDSIKVPPCFIVVCNNTATSKVVYDYIAGFERENKDGTSQVIRGRLPLFNNYDDYDQPYARPRTLLIDSTQLESGEPFDKKFHSVAKPEIERFRRELIERGQQKKAENIKDQDLLREVMNTVGKEERLGESIRCVVSVSMLTEGWDANNVTHILGVRAFGTQLLCEQVVGRALRRLSYQMNDDDLFDVEYADVLGVPFDFTSQAVEAKTKPPRPTIQVKAIRERVTPERTYIEIRFPRVEGYRVDFPEESLKADFTEDSRFILTNELTGPNYTINSGIIGENVDLTPERLEDVRPSQLVYNLTAELLMHYWRDEDGNPKMALFGQLRRIVRHWLDNYFECKGDAKPHQLMYRELARMACEKINAGVTRAMQESTGIKAMLDPFNPTGSTRHVNFATSKQHRWETDSRKCHINWVVLDSDWEAIFCQVAERHPRVKSYVKNHNLGFEVPYTYGSQPRTYIPDFIVLVDDGHGDEDLLNLIVEIKGYRREDAKVKKETMETYWVPGVNNLGSYGRWAFAEFTDVHDMKDDFGEWVEKQIDKVIEAVGEGKTIIITEQDDDSV